MVYLEHFGPDEFGEWANAMSPRLAVMLDILRHQLDRPIKISPHPLALGRHLGPGHDSDHNVDKWGEVLAADLFVGLVHTRTQASRVIHTARHVGFTAIGIYPQWTNAVGVKQVGFHLGVRPTRKMGDPAEWGFYDGRMTTLENALHLVPMR